MEPHANSVLQDQYAGARGSHGVKCQYVSLITRTLTRRKRTANALQTTQKSLRIQTEINVTQAMMRKRRFCYNGPVVEKMRAIA